MDSMELVCRFYMGGFPKLGVPFWGSQYIKELSILGSILGSPYFRKVLLAELIFNMSTKLFNVEQAFKHTIIVWEFLKTRRTFMTSR